METIDKYSYVEGECPYCKAHLVYRNNLMIFASYPPQHQYTCKRCGYVWSAHNDKEAVEPIKNKEDSPMHNSAPSLNSEGISEETTAGKSFSYSINNIDIPIGPSVCDIPGEGFKYWGQQGWVCPKCGAVMAPWMSECHYCKPTTNKIITSPNTSPSFPDDYINYRNMQPKTYSGDASNIASTSAGPNPNITA